MGFSHLEQFICRRSVNEMSTDPWGETNSPVVRSDTDNQFENNFEVDSSYTPLEDSQSYIQTLGKTFKKFDRGNLKTKGLIIPKVLSV